MKTAAPTDARPAAVCIEFKGYADFDRAKTQDSADAPFTESEWTEIITSPASSRAFAVRLAAKRAACELFPREVIAGLIRPVDFEIREVSELRITVHPGESARGLLARRLVAGVEVSVKCAGSTATATAQLVQHPLHEPWFGTWAYHLFPFRRRLTLANLHRVFGEFVPAERIRRLACAYYAHVLNSLLEMIRLPLMSKQRRAQWVRVENVESLMRAHDAGKGLIVLTGHFGNWEAATVAALKQFPQYAGKFHFLRRPLKPRWFDRLITRRFRRAGFETLSKRGSMEAILKLLGEGAIIVFTFDQHAGRPDGIPVEFLGQPAGTFKSLAILALSTETAVIPACTWREPDGRHVLRFEEPVPLIQNDNVGEAIRQNTRAYNAALERMLLRHPEQWIWMHRRWKLPPR